MRAAVALVVTAACLGCGTTRPAPAERQWVANTRGVIRQLQADLRQVSGTDSVTEANRTLADSPASMSRSSPTPTSAAAGTCSPGSARHRRAFDASTWS